MRTKSAKAGKAFTKGKGDKAPKPRRDLHAEITDRIVKAMEKGALPWLKPWQSETRHVGHPRNARTRRRYNGINILLLFAEQVDRGFASSEWVSYQQAIDLGGHVRKGETGTEIVFFKPIPIKETNDDGDEVERQIPLMKTYRVYNVDQCEGLNLKAPSPEFEPQATPEGLDKRFMDAVRETGAVINTGGDRAFYRPSTDEITMPKVEAFRDVAHYQATLAHELIHWTGAKHRLDRISGEQGKQGYAAEELVAEMGAAFVCAEFGIEGDLRHEGYLESWIAHLKDDNRAIFRAASRASKATAYAFPDVDPAVTYEAEAA